MDKFDGLVQKLLILIAILIFIFLLADLSVSTIAVCEGSSCKAVPVINLLPALR